MIKPLSRIVLAISLGVTSSVLLSANSTLAQVQSSDADPYQSNEKDNMSGTLGGINPIDLIHNANLSVGRNAEEFNQDSRIQIQNSAAEFRRLQQERILQQYNRESQPTEDLPE